MFIDHVNLNHIRIFECVYRTRSMTVAAKELHLTQSGVSQHIKSLEGMLGLKLFDRIQQKLVPTSMATDLFQECSHGLQRIENALWKLKTSEKDLSGTVSIGMPIEFGNNLIIPLLAKFGRKYPRVHFKIHQGLAPTMNEMLLKGELDFAFVDDFQMDRRMETQKVYDEVLELCISEDNLKERGAPKHNRKYFESLEYIEYQEDAPILKMWFSHHLESTTLTLNIRTTVMDVQAVARLILNDVGAGILPGHLVGNLIKEGARLHRFKGCGKPLKNSISVAYLSERTHSPAVQAVLASLKKSLGTDGVGGKAPADPTS